MVIDYGKGEVEVDVSTWTLVLYEQEFGKDLIKDVFGRSEVREDADDVMFVVDFTQSNWTAFVRLLWAAIKTVDDSLPSFKEWARKEGYINVNTIMNELTEAALKGLFRTGVEGISEE